ncbi:MAG: polymorphic toxin type 4 domain-containing protein [Flavobacteriales bacterium]|nr:polymorphic toxin type 4 domain-containing protein [Flavobacteriales bacterium]
MVFREIPQPGNELVKLDASGNLVIRSRVDKGQQRQDLENNMLPGSRVGLQGWERSHSQGAGTGHESPFGIVYAPSIVNQQYQNLGVEKKIRDLFEALPKFEKRKGDIILVLQTVTATWWETFPKKRDTRRLKDITYTIESHSQSLGTWTILFEATIWVDNAALSPRCGFEVDPNVSVGMIWKENPFYR